MTELAQNNRMALLYGSMKQKVPRDPNPLKELFIPSQHNITLFVLVGQDLWGQLVFVLMIFGV